MSANDVMSIVLAILTSVLASSGLWAYMAKRYEAKLQHKLESDADRAAERAMLVGLAHDRIVSQGMMYIERGYITQDEHENLDVYLFGPYTKLGGNGSAAKIMQEVNKLPMVRPKTASDVA